MKNYCTKLFCHASVIALAWAIQAQATTVTVTPSDMQGWSFWSLNNTYTGPQPGSTGAMVTGPATPPLGVGSAELSTAPNGGDGGVGLTTGAYDGTLFSSLGTLSYSTYDTANNGQQFPYLAINVDLNDGSGNQDTLFFEPPYQTPAAGGPTIPDQGAPVMNEWQTWDASEGGWWDNNDVLGTGGYDEVGFLSAFEALYPNATVADSDAPFGFIDGVTLQVGFADTNTETGYVDDFSVGSTTYDFEPDVSSVPEPTTVIAGAFLLLPLGISVLRKLSKKQTA